MVVAFLVVVVTFFEVVETFLLVVVAGFVMAHLHRLVSADAVYDLNGEVVLGLDKCQKQHAQSDVAKRTRRYKRYRSGRAA